MVRNINISACLFSTTDISSSISLLRNWRNGTYPAYMMYWTGSYVLYYKCTKLHHVSKCNWTAYPDDQRGHKASGHSDRTLKSVVTESAARHNIRDAPLLSSLAQYKGRLMLKPEQECCTCTSPSRISCPYQPRQHGRKGL